MIKIALCDDDNIFLDEFANKIEVYFNKMKNDICLNKFNSGKDLLIFKEPIDFVFLDIDMPEINGTEVAKIMNKHKKTHIIFVTNHDSLVYESFQYQPIRFLRKSKIERELNETLETIINLYTSETKTISFNTKNGKIVERINDIIYIEVFNHDVVVHTVEHELHVYGTLNEYERRLKADGFVKTYKNCLVNCYFVYSINRCEVVLDNQQTLPLSRYKANSVKAFFHDYIRRT